MRGSSRELSSRVSINVHRQPNRQRRWAWGLALLAGVGSLTWLATQYLQRQHRLYQAGDVATTHRMFENECWRCHTAWAPLDRLLSFRNAFSSTMDEQCETCHKVADHQPQRRLAHGGISCAACHQEHRGAETLARPSSQFCVSCHADLQSHGGKTAYANNITRFDAPRGHPDFLLTQLLKKETPLTAGADLREELPVENFQRPGVDQDSHWQDRGRIRFNHARHLHARYGENKNQPVEGLFNEKRELVDLSDKCETCHQPDAEHRFFKPIQFEAHCAKCHPLLFDPANFPGQTVPHELPKIVRGFLTETYTLRALSKARSPMADKAEQPVPSALQPQHAAIRDEPDGDADQPRRPFPGHRDQQKLTQEQAQSVLSAVAQAETFALNRRQNLLGREAAGGCRYCHEVNEVEPQPPSSLSDWKIVPTRIPARWLPHGEFHHEPHRLLNCGVCHVGVDVSEKTGDVLIPSQAVCLACHSSQPAKWSSNWQAWFREQEQWVEQQEAALVEHRKEWVTRLEESSPSTATTKRAPSKGVDETSSFQYLIDNADRGSRTDCIECHRYHSPTGDKWNGPFVPKIVDHPKPASDETTK